MRRPHLSLAHVTGLTYSILCTAVLLLLLAVAEVVLEARLERVFGGTRVQYPGSSLAEWLFVSMNPQYIDAGPSNMKFAVAACSFAAAVLALTWIVAAWWAVRKIITKRLARSTCVATVLNTASALGFMTYILVRESQNTLPKYFVWWRKTSFTREFYVCVAFPSIFDGTERFESAERIYGFPACGVALAAKYVLIAICCVSTVLAGLSVLQAQKSGAFGGRGKRLDMEKAWPGKIEGERSNGLPKQLKASIRGALQEKNVIAPRRAHGEIRMPFAAMPRVEKPRLDRYF